MVTVWAQDLGRTVAITAQYNLEIPTVNSYLSAVPPVSAKGGQAESKRREMIVEQEHFWLFAGTSFLFPFSVGNARFIFRLRVSRRGGEAAAAQLPCTALQQVQGWQPDSASLIQKLCCTESNNYTNNLGKPTDQPKPIKKPKQAKKRLPLSSLLSHGKWITRAFKEACSPQED